MTPAGGQLDWLWAVAAWSLCAAGLAAIGWALLWDRTRGKKRCPGCWYDLTGIGPVERDARQVWTCPECGRESAGESRLHRTRRRWRWAAVGAGVLIAAHVAFSMPRVRAGGWAGLVPTTGLIWWVAHYEPAERFDRSIGKMVPPTPVAAELARRVSVGGVWDWQSRWMIDALGLIRSRREWPRDQEYCITTGLPRWLQAAGVTFSTSCELAPRAKHYDHPALPWEIAVLGERRTSVPLDVIFGSWDGRVELPVRVVDTAEDAMEAVSNPALDDAVRRSLGVGINADPNPSTNTNYMIGARLFRSLGLLPEDVAFGLVVDVLRDGELKLTWTAHLGGSTFGEPVDWMRINAPAPGWGTEGDGEIDHWTVRVRGDADASLTDFGRTRYWAGQFEVPLKDVLQRSVEGEESGDGEDSGEGEK